ncbi:hypothetical protein AOL_s00080g430 [Orbilia oligospora ATCC 24927]|uniref:C2H2-type domain-containing protein n=1 Tax=Arthrobotrys oligospora (strain ATCC 24927 / CBS 115.81 / DSM 1491) TaxID=756982 RepID=G1XF45_ARTOA|nr:hypothetical protein AOL_s00080g430 [Orbilia oligospora ATCC 24927]EGX48305.1 hypothetical protein AOL_s00080g430 [Orbilia oligospora ATCC 24927]
MDESTNISRIASECKTIFAGCISTPGMGEEAWVRSAQGDFNLWCLGIKATSSNKSSLDYRLREKPDVREDICDLIRGLINSLQKCQRLLIGTEGENAPEDSRPDSPQSIESWEAMSDESSGTSSLSGGGDVSNPVLSENISYIKTILSQLARISVAIRKSGNRYRFEKADAALDEKDYDEFRQHLTAIILRGFEDDDSKNLTAVEKAQRVFDSSRLTKAQKRLIHLNILRKHRIEFVKRSRGSKPHQNADTQQTESGPIMMRKPTEEPTVDSKPCSYQPIRSTTTSRPLHQPPRKLAPSGVFTAAVTATEIGSKFDIKGILATKSTSAVTKMTKIGASQSYPHCPDPRLDGSLRCPYCDDFLPSEFSDPKRQDNWRLHVVQDIIPYSCIIDGCDTPDEMYTTAERLLTHMLEKHSTARWTCSYCVYSKGINGLSDTEPNWFDTAQEWDLHMAANHGEIVPSNQRDTLAELNKELTIGPLSCPLCEFTTDSADTKVDNHILQHLHEFSLRALPEDVKQKGDNQITTSQASGLLSHTQSDHIGVAMDQEWPMVALEELESSLKRVLNLHPYVDRYPPPTLKHLPPDANKALTEIWQLRSYRLKTTLDDLNSDLHDVNGMECVSSMLDGIPEAIRELNSITGMDLTLPFVNYIQNSPTHVSVPPLVWSPTPRDEILDEVESLFICSQQDSIRGKQSRLALVGPKGVGKTAIAKMFVDRMWEQSENRSIFWVDASLNSKIDRSYEIIARTLGVSLDWTGSGSDLIRHLINHLAWTFSGEWLIVFDGLQYQTAAYLTFENLLPQGLRGHLLFTTSDPSCLALFGTVKTIQIPELSKEQQASIELSETEINDLIIEIDNLKAERIKLIMEADELETETIDLTIERDSLIREVDLLKAERNLLETKKREFALIGNIYFQLEELQEFNEGL